MASPPRHYGDPVPHPSLRRSCATPVITEILAPTPPSLRGAQRRRNPAIPVIASRLVILCHTRHYGDPGSHTSSLRGAQRRRNPAIPVIASRLVILCHTRHYGDPGSQTSVIARSTATPQSTCCSSCCKFIYCSRSKTVLRAWAKVIVII